MIPIDELELNEMKSMSTGKGRTAYCDSLNEMESVFTGKGVTAYRNELDNIKRIVTSNERIRGCNFCHFIRAAN